MAAGRRPLVAGIGSAASDGAPPAWNTYVSVENADAIVPRGDRSGRDGAVASRSTSGRPAGWRRSPIPRAPRSGSGRPAARTARSSSMRPASWNWSDLETRDLEAAKAFYSAVFGWEYKYGRLRPGTVGDDPRPGLRRPPRGTDARARSPATRSSARPRASRTRSAGCRRPPVRTAPPAGRSPSRSPTSMTPPAAHRTSAARCWSSPSTCPTSGMAVVRDLDGATFAIGTFKPPSRRS